MLFVLYFSFIRLGLQKHKRIFCIAALYKSLLLLLLLTVLRQKTRPQYIVVCIQLHPYMKITVQYVFRNDPLHQTKVSPLA